VTTLTRLDCGELEGDLAMFEAGARGRVTLPVSAWLIRHPRGTALFDAGMPPSFVAGSPCAQRVAQLMTIRFGADDTVAAQLEAQEQDPGRVDFVIASHLHFDHVGGLALIPNAALVIQRAEWEAGQRVPRGAPTLHERDDYDLGHPLRLADGEHDLFGDGAVVCVPTPGHTVGHQSLRVRLASGEDLVLTADCCLFARTLDGGALPTFGHDLEQQRRSLDRLRALRRDGARVVPGHDVEALAGLPRVLGR